MWYLGFPDGPVVKNMSWNAGDTDLTPTPGRSHMLWGNKTRALRKPTLPRAHTLQQEKPPQWKACARQLESSPHMLQLEKARTHPVLFSHSAMFDSLQPRGLQHARLPWPSLSPGVCSNSCPLNWWCHLTISSSTAPFSCPQSFPVSGSFPMNRLFASSGQSVGASTSASVLPMNIQGWFPLGLTGLIPLLSQRTLQSLLQHHNLKASVFQCLAFFRLQLPHLYMTMGKTIALTIQTFVSKVMSLLFNTLSRFVFLLYGRSLLILCFTYTVYMLTPNA